MSAFEKIRHLMSIVLSVSAILLPIGFGLNFVNEEIYQFLDYNCKENPHNILDAIWSGCFQFFFPSWLIILFCVVSAVAHLAIFYFVKLVFFIITKLFINKTSASSCEEQSDQDVAVAKVNEINLDNDPYPTSG